MNLAGMTRGERISAAKRGLIPPVRSERERQLRSRYGLTLEGYDELLQRGNGACWACGGVCKYDLYVDHDHETGAVRGLLCARCNNLAGLLDDAPRIWGVWEYIFTHRHLGDDRP